MEIPSSASASPSGDWPKPRMSGAITRAVFRESGDLGGPHGVVEWKAVEQEHGDAVAAVDVSEIAARERNFVHGCKP